MKIKTLRQIKSLAGKRVIIRVDYNVPMAQSKIKDDFKIKKQLPTLKYLLKQKARVIIITHLGRPHAKKIDISLSVKPLSARLSVLLGKKVKFIAERQFLKIGNEINKIKDGGVVMLENIRFYPEEEKNDKRFAKQLAALGDIYVNDAFAASHRAHASVNAVQKYLPSYAGLLLEAEVMNLEKVLNPAKPLVIVVGGAKIKTKLPLIYKLEKKAHRILVGGALANSFLKARGLETGRSLVDQPSVRFAREFNSKKILLPIDVVVSGQEAGMTAAVKNVMNVSKLDYIYDVGPKTIRFFAGIIKEANTIIWNGPLGAYEKKAFQHGTLAIGRLIAARSTGKAFGAAGGGETVEALKMTKMLHFVDWVSTGGGAMLEYLGGAPMPGFLKIIR